MFYLSIFSGAGVVVLVYVLLEYFCSAGTILVILVYVLLEYFYMSYICNLGNNQDFTAILSLKICSIYTIYSKCMGLFFLTIHLYKHFYHCLKSLNTTITCRYSKHVADRYGTV